jgi:hypothetical protein
MKRAQQANVWLDDQAKADAQTIARYHGLSGVSAAIRFALRELARRIEAANVATNVAELPKDTPDTAP